MKRRPLLAAVREIMRRQDAARAVEHAEPPVPRAAAPAPAAERPAPRAQPDHELDQLAAEARYHRDRFQLYRARVMSGSSVPTSPARLRELERTAAAAQERLAHARTR